MTVPTAAPSSGDVGAFIIVFNNAATIGEAIDSVVRQSSPPGEVVVIDDGSTDGSGDVARSFGHRVRVVRQENRGVAAARNRGIAETRGALIASVDADDRWALNKLERQLPLLVDGTEAVSCHVAQVVQRDWHDVVYQGATPAQVLPGPIWEALVIRRAAFARIGWFDRSYRVAEQVDWWARAAEAGLQLASVPEPLVYRRVHDQNHGIRQQAHRLEYVRAVHAVIKRRRAAAAESAGQE